MTQYSAAAWIGTGVIFLCQGVIIYAAYQYLSLGRLSINPFQPGWNHLYQLYGTLTGPKSLTMTSMVIGSANYKNSMLLAFNEENIFLQKRFFPAGFLQLPYQGFTVMEVPKRVTILGFSFSKAGLFRIAGVNISFGASQANELIARLAKTNP